MTADFSRLSGPVLLARAGAWLKHHGPLHLPRAKGLMAVGSDGSAEWGKLLRKCGGDFSRLKMPWRKQRLPFSPVVFCEEAEPLRRLLADGHSMNEALEILAFEGALRVIRLPSLDASHSKRIRVIQVVTSVQTGGAERITLGLAEELNHQGVATAVIALGMPTRTAFPAPPAFMCLADLPNRPQEKASAILTNSIEWGADIIHAHLIKDGFARAIKAQGLPLVMTVHNSKPGWPEGMQTISSESADLLLACSKHVARELPAVPGVPVRVLLNGIDAARFAPTPTHIAAGKAWRKKLRIAPSAPVLLLLANPRPQKRMDRLPAILFCLLEAHLIIAGEPSIGAEDLVGELKLDFADKGLTERVHWIGTAEFVQEILAACDVLVSTSDWEGLSLAHLEALAAQKPVVATDAGGTREIAAVHPALTLLEREVTPQKFADAVRQACASGNHAPFSKEFTRYAMARRAAHLYERVLAPPVVSARKKRLWLVTNNFSTGGAQTSARKLLLAMMEEGYEVRAAVIQENPDHPTPGRGALISAGIPVTAVPPPECFDAAEACRLLLEKMDSAAPDCVVFWNLITSYKVILADALWGCRVVDVSPGAMFYSSLDSYFSSPRKDVPCTTAWEYGHHLSAMVVKYHAEKRKAEHTLGAPVMVIRNSVAISKVPTRARGKNAPLVFATAARLSPDKCLGQLITALKLAAPRLPAWKLRVAGGPERDHKHHAKELLRMAKGLPVEWCGNLPTTADFLADADIFLMISEPPGCPNASLEALASGLPVIATDVGGAAEQVIDEQSGLLVPPDNAPALADAIVRLAADQSLRRRLGQAGHDHVRKQFSMEQMIEGYRKMFFPEEASALAAQREPLIACVPVGSLDG